MGLLFKIICGSIIILLIERSAEVNSDFMLFNTFSNTRDCSTTSRQKSAHKLTRNKQVGGNSLEQAILECNCPLCKALISLKSTLSCEERWLLFPCVQSSSFYPFSSSLCWSHCAIRYTIVTVPQTKTCFERLLQMWSLKIKQLCSNCFSSSPPAAAAFSILHMKRKLANIEKCCTLTFIALSCLRHSYCRFLPFSVTS